MLAVQTFERPSKRPHGDFFKERPVVSSIFVAHYLTEVLTKAQFWFIVFI